MPKDPKPAKPTEIQLQNAFLSAYGENVDIERAAADAGVSTAQHYRWLDTNEKYRAAFDLVLRHLVDRLVTAGFHRATVGTPKLVHRNGELIQVPQLNRYTGQVMIDSKGKTVMGPLIEWDIDYRAWDKLIEAWDPDVFNRGAVGGKEKGTGKKTKVKQYTIHDRRANPNPAFPRIASSVRSNGSA